MKDEISAAVLFLVRLIERSGGFSGSEGVKGVEGATGGGEEFGKRLEEILLERFQGHWFPEKPCRGQAYRCIRLNENQRADPVIERAARCCGLSYQNLHLPVELTIWVDPGEVCCRFGEHKGSYCTLASFKNGSKEYFVDNINLDEIQRKSKLHKDQMASGASVRRSTRKTMVSVCPPTPNGVSSNKHPKPWLGSSGNYHPHPHLPPHLHPHPHHLPHPHHHHNQHHWYNGANANSGGGATTSDSFSPGLFYPPSNPQPPPPPPPPPMKKFSSPFKYHHHPSSAARWTGNVFMANQGASSAVAAAAWRNDRYHWVNKTSVKA